MARYGRSAFKPKRCRLSDRAFFVSRKPGAWLVVGENLWLFPFCSLSFSVLLFPALCLFPFFLPAFFSFLSAFSLFFLSFCCFRRIKNAFAAAVKVIRNRKQKRFLWTWYMCDTPSEKDYRSEMLRKEFLSVVSAKFSEELTECGKKRTKTVDRPAFCLTKKRGNVLIISWISNYLFT